MTALAELLRIEPTKSHATGKPDGFAWFVFDNGRSYHRRMDRERNHARSDFPAPAIRTDSCDPIRGADGKLHDSLSSYRKTLEPGGNPQGERYFELGNESLEEKTTDFDPKQRRDDIRAALEDVKNGHVPQLTTLED